MYTTPHSWMNIATVVYLDQPVGTGFSTGTPLLTNMEQLTSEFIYFMNQLYETFPDLKGKDLYMTGESYAGHYIPAFSLELLKDDSFNLKASLIGDPDTAPLT